jgi:hypothetical protein
MPRRTVAMIRLQSDDARGVAGAVSQDGHCPYVGSDIDEDGIIHACQEGIQQNELRLAGMLGRDCVIVVESRRR